MESFMIVIISIACILLYEYKDDDEVFSILLIVIISLTIIPTCSVVLKM